MNYTAPTMTATAAKTANSHVLRFAAGRDVGFGPGIRKILDKLADFA